MLCLTNYGPVLVLFFLCKVYVILRTVLFEPLLFWFVILFYYLLHDLEITISEI